MCSDLTRTKERLSVLLTVPTQTASLGGGSKWKKITVLMPCYVFTPPLFWVAGVVLLATSVLFSSALPTSVLTFKKESGPGYWVPHQWHHSHVDCPCIIVWHALLVTSCLCWCQLAVSAGWPCRSFRFFSVIKPLLPNMHWGWLSPLSVPLHFPPSLYTNTHITYC